MYWFGLPRWEYFPHLQIKMDMKGTAYKNVIQVQGTTAIIIEAIPKSILKISILALVEYDDYIYFERQ